MKNSKQYPYGLIILTALTLTTACETSEPKSSAANITQLTLTVGGEDKTVSFNDKREATLTHQYTFGQDAPTTATVKSISLSGKATASVESEETLTLINNQASITVTAEDGSTQTYTLSFTFTIAANTAAEITTLVLTLNGVDKTVTFDEDRSDTVTHQFPFGAAAPTQATVKEIALSQGAAATVTSNETLPIGEDNTATITVTAEDGSTQTYTLFFELTQAPDLGTLSEVVASGSVPADLPTYSEVARAVLAPYTAGATVVANYVTVAGAGTKDGSSWDNAADAENLKSTLDGIGDASSSKVYLLLVAAGSYDAGAALSMKNNVAIVGGWEIAGGWKRPVADTTTFSGGDTHQVVESSGLSPTAVLYGAKITAGRSDVSGGGMHNTNASPTITSVVFIRNTAGTNGGGIMNYRSHPTLTNVTFTGNTATFGGGGINNTGSSPTLTKVTFTGNRAKSGGGMHNKSAELVRLTNVTFVENTAENGGGIHSDLGSYLHLTNVTFTANAATISGGGIYNDGSGTTGPVVVNSLFWGNTATRGNAQIALDNDTGTRAENITLAYSIIQGGADSTALATTANGDTVNITATGIVTTDPALGMRVNNSGGVQTVAIASGSTAQNIGVYVRRGNDGTFYYSEDNSTWYTRITAEGLADTATPPADAEDLTATDATGTARSRRPDAGAYEAR